MTVFVNLADLIGVGLLVLFCLAVFVSYKIDTWRHRRWLRRRTRERWEAEE